MPRARTWPLCIIVTLWLSGCLNQESIKILRYDAKADRFHLLAVYEHFRSSSNSFAGPDEKQEAKTFAEDAAKLRSIFDSRDRLIPGYLDIGGPSLAELKPDRSGFTNDQPAAGQPPIAWDKVVIRPGKLFKDPAGYIGFWQEVEFPGNVVDQMLARQRFELSKGEDLRAELERVRKDRTDKSTKPASWDALAKWVRTRLDDVQAGKPEANPKNSDAQLKEFGDRLLACMDIPSIDALLAAMTRNELGPTRKGSTFVLSLPVTRRDAEGVIAIVQQVGEFTKPLAAPNAQAPKGPAEALVLIYAPVVATGKITADDKGLEASIDVVALLNHLSKQTREKENKDFATNKEAQAKAQKMADKVATWNDVPLAPNTDAEALIKEFTARPFPN